MKNTIYIVKKDPTKPNSQDNWILMNLKEFNSFIQTPESKGRYFADIGGHEESDTWYIVECPKETAMKWRKELNRHYYLKRMERESGYQTVSYDCLVIDGEELNGEELIFDCSDNFVAEVMYKIDIQTLEKALDSLTIEEYEIIHYAFLSDERMSERTLAAMLTIPRTTLEYRIDQILVKLKKFF